MLPRRYIPILATLLLLAPLLYLELTQQTRPELPSKTLSAPENPAATARAPESNGSRVSSSEGVRATEQTRPESPSKAPSSWENPATTVKAPSVQPSQTPPRQQLQVTGASLTADPVKFEGLCPKKFIFEGEITVDAPGTVRYTFTRNDGATGREETLTFESPGTLSVETSWTLGGSYIYTDPTPRHYDGWVRLRILSPNMLESKKAGFDLACRQPEISEVCPPQKFRVTNVSLTADPVKFRGPCPKSINFGGQITVDGPGTVCYNFLRSDGAMAPVETLTFEAAGTRSVKTSWTLGPFSQPFPGWQAIQVLSPNPMESKKAGFELICR